MAQLNETTSAGGGEESVAASLGLNPQLFVFQLINFGLVFLIIWYLILRPLTKKLDERRKIIDESLERAKEIETSYGMSEQKYIERLKIAEDEANTIIGKAQEEAESIGLALKEKTKKEIQALASEAKQHIQKEREEALTQVRNEAASMVVAAVEKVLGEKMDQKKDEKFIHDMVSELK